MKRSSEGMRERERARALRRTLTLSELRLWGWLRNRSFASFKFRRQFPIGRFVLDFYCPELKLAIEVDGAHHSEPGMAHFDDKRTRLLTLHGILVLRIENVLLAKNPRLAAEKIRFAVEQRAQEKASARVRC